MRALLFFKAEHRKRFVYQPVYHLPARGMYTNAQVFRSESKTKFHQTFGGGAPHTHTHPPHCPPVRSQYLCCFTMYSCERVHLSEGKFVQFSFSDLSPPLPPPLASCPPPLSLSLTRMAALANKMFLEPRDVAGARNCGARHRGEDVNFCFANYFLSSKFRSCFRSPARSVRTRTYSVDISAKRLEV